MESELIGLGQLGLAGAVITVLIVQVRYLQDKLLSVIERNTVAMEQLKAVIDKCQDTHRAG